MIYLDNGATTYPKPQGVKSAVSKAISMFGANPGRSGYDMSIKTGEEVYRARLAVADFFNADGAENIIFQPSCTQALNTVLKGCLKEGDHVAVSDIEHNAVMRPLKKLKKEKGISYTVVKTYPGNDELTVSSFRQAINADTKLLVCTHASNVFGFRLPVSRLAALAHFYNVKICVDAAQTAGVLPIDIKDNDIDYLCCAGHKGLYGLMGTGLLIMRRDDKLETLIEGGTGTQSRIMYQPDEPPERYESGTQNIPGICGLKAGIDFVKRVGISKIYKHEMKLITTLYDALKTTDKIILYHERPDERHFVPVLSFNIDGIESEEVGSYLADNDIAVRSGLHCAPMAHEKMGSKEGTVRVVPSAFTRENEIYSLIKAIRKI